MHSTNGIFASDQFYLECDNKHQEKYFSGAGAQHQNERSERAIQTIMYMVKYLWLTITCIGKIMGPMKYPFGTFPSSMLYGCIIAYQIAVPLPHH